MTDKACGIWVVDVSYVLNKYKKHPPLMSIYDNLPLKKILERLLSLSYFVDYSDHLNELLDDANIDTLDVDIDYLYLLIEGMIQEVDDVITKNTRIDDGDYYLFKEWLGRNGIIIQIMEGH